MSDPTITPNRRRLPSSPGPELLAEKLKTTELLAQEKPSDCLPRTNEGEAACVVGGMDRKLSGAVGCTVQN
jgi:hypothetical protein